MPENALALLDRQYERLQSAEGAAFVTELRRFDELLTTGPEPVVAAVEAARGEAAAIECEFDQHDQALVPDLIALREELVRRAPEADDSAVGREGAHHPSKEWVYGLANFDQVAAGGPDQMVEKHDMDGSRSAMLLLILHAKLRDLQWMTEPRGPNPKESDRNLRPDLDELGRRVRNAADRHRNAAQKFKTAVVSHGGFQVQYLDLAVAEMNPEPEVIETEQDAEESITHMLRRMSSGWHVLEVAAGGRPLNDMEARTLDFLQREKLLPAAEHVYEDVRTRVATAPAPQPAPLSYGERMRRWMLSPGYALLGGPTIGGFLTAVFTEHHEGLGWFIALAVLSTVLPPSLRLLPKLTYTRANIAFIVAVSAAVTGTMVVVGFGVALVVFAVAAIAYFTGQVSRTS